MSERDRGRAGAGHPGAADRGDVRLGGPLACERQDDLDAILEALRRSTVQTIRELERRFGVARQYDVRITRKAHPNPPNYGCRNMSDVAS